jgi:hypothetical protein
MSGRPIFTTTFGERVAVCGLAQGTMLDTLYLSMSTKGEKHGCKG